MPRLRSPVGEEMKPPTKGKCGCEPIEYIHNEKHDAYYCGGCNKWLEKVCNEPDCDYCKGRPDKPSEAVND